MTKKQKQIHIDDIVAVITSKGFELDRWANYVLKKDHIIFRIKLMKNNLRFEYKKNAPKSVWFKVFSKPIVKVDIDGLNEYLNQRIKL